MMFFTLLPGLAIASEADLIMPALNTQQNSLLTWGFVICGLGLLFAAIIYRNIKKLPTHESMKEVSEIIFSTCKTYLIQQGKMLSALFILISVVIAFYFGFLEKMPVEAVVLILIWTIVGILGSYGVSWFGIRINTIANSRMTFASIIKKPLEISNIPLKSGMSIGVMLICIELILMLIILTLMPREYVGACFIGFAIGESLGASVLRIAGGIFTKIADIGADLMKVFYKIDEDDPRNPGVIADCTGDNAGDSVGPTGDGLETYGVTGVALIAFIVLGVFPKYQAELITWIFVMRIIMVITSIVSFWLNQLLSIKLFAKKENIDFEKPLTKLVWISSVFSIIISYLISYLIIGPTSLIGQEYHSAWIIFASIISCGTLGAALIPEFTKLFTSTKSKHVKEIVSAGKKGGASLTILAGLVAGNFSAFWKGMIFFGLMFLAYIISTMGLDIYMIYPAIFAFGLVAFGFLSMGPVTIAVDSYGPVTDNAQSIYELSRIEKIPNIASDIERNYSFRPNFDKAKEYLEKADGAGNTFKATAKPVLIGTAVAGSTTLIFSLILIIKNVLGVEPELILNLLNPYTILGFICGGAVVYWFSGASIQAVTSGAYQAVDYIKKNINLDETSTRASLEKSNHVVRICTNHAQKGMLNIFIGVFSFSLAFAFLSAPSESNAPVSFFISYLISLAIFGLFQAMFMANAGGAWDNAKKIVEGMKEKGTALHDAMIVGDTVGDPFKDTSSVALNPIIKFTTLFGLLAMEIAISPIMKLNAIYIGMFFFIVALYFVYRSFYKMTIK